MSKIFVVGGGPAGMMAAITAARRGKNVILLEKNEKLGKKLYITGKGRCNLTNACDRNTFFSQVVTNPKFLYKAFATFDNMAVMDFFEELGLTLKTERGMRVFPASDKSSDVIATLRRELERLGVDIRYNSKVTEIIVKDNAFYGLKVNNEPDILMADAIIIATGGLSYPLTGSTGDGFRFAKAMGHTVTDMHPALVPLLVRESFVKDLMGLSLKNIGITVYAGSKEIYVDFGEMLFTHFGVSGPVILSASSYIIPYLDKKEPITLSIDLKPALSHEQLDARILRDFEEFKNKQFKNSLVHLLPNKLIDVIIRLSGIDPCKQVNMVTRQERKTLLELLKNFTLHISGLCDYNQAVITRGGINIKEVNPSTMESKIIKGVYFAGELLDLDALTGGFNLQIAWSTGYLAGMSVT